ncbi:MAG: 5-formyltetrahydrofolate cyclo-ligase [Halobacteriaceae archaeon]
MDKQALRERVWDELEEHGDARFPFPPHDRIPNFAGAADAAARLAETPVWERASVVKANPDAPQLPVRRRALRAGKTVYVAVPRLRDRDCFYRLDPATIEDVDAATTVSGIGEAGDQVGPDDVASVDLVVSGSVAVSPTGARIGKGEGYSDLEYAILSAVDAVDGETVTVTTVHERQVRTEDWVADSHDVPMEHILTPERTIETGADAVPTSIDWTRLDEEDRAAIPVLETLDR